MTPRWQPRAVHGMVHAVISRSLSQRRFAVGVSFVAAIALVVILNRRSSGTADAPGEPRFHFTNIAHEAGIDFVHHGPTLDPKLDNIAPLIGSLGASVTVSDVNNDGWPDLYFTNSRFGFPNALYLNRGDGTFVDTARASGLADVNRSGEGVSMGAVWGDFDNDGLEDVLIYKWGYLQLFKNMGDLHFKDVTASAGLRQWMNANGAVWFDYDRDGLLPIRHRLLAPEDHAHHGEQLRVRHQRGQEPPVSQSRRWTLRRCHRSDGGGQHPLDPGGRGGGLQRRRLARPVPGERLRPGRALPERPRPALHPEPRGPGERFEERHVGHAGRRAESRARGRLRDQHLGAGLPVSREQPAPQFPAGAGPVPAGGRRGDRRRGVGLGSAARRPGQRRPQRPVHR